MKDVHVSLVLPTEIMEFNKSELTTCSHWCGGVVCSTEGLVYKQAMSLWICIAEQKIQNVHNF